MVYFSCNSQPSQWMVVSKFLCNREADLLDISFYPTPSLFLEAVSRGFTFLICQCIKWSRILYYFALKLVILSRDGASADVVCNKSTSTKVVSKFWKEKVGYARTYNSKNLTEIYPAV